MQEAFRIHVIPLSTFSTGMITVCILNYVHIIPVVHRFTMHLLSLSIELKDIYGTHDHEQLYSIAAYCHGSSSVDTAVYSVASHMVIFGKQSLVNIMDELLPTFETYIAK